jgi:predicted lipoprotein with Yx(FWY)xxD motif
MRSTRSHHRAGGLAAIVAAILLVGACTESGADVRSAAPTGSLTPASSAEASAANAEAYVINAASGAVGAYLTGADGRTLYTFKPDSADTSTCTGGCASTWPPFTVGAGGSLTAGSGVSGKLTTFTRADGTMQVAYNGAPLYSFKNDIAAGDTNGQGIGGQWFVAAP